MEQSATQARVEQMVLSHLDAAYNLARWLTGDADDAQDVVQEACLRAIRSFEGYRGGDGRSWLLTIVRNTGYTWLKKNRQHQAATGMDEEMQNIATDAPNPEQILMRGVDASLLTHAMERLPPEFREVLILREQEGMSYKGIAEVCQIPLGTVMSRLARARGQMQQLLTGRDQGAQV